MNTTPNNDVENVKSETLSTRDDDSETQTDNGSGQATEISRAGSHLGRIRITAKMRIMTGMHIGTSSDSLDIGGIDNLIVRDLVSNEPYTSGSTVKGKARSLLEKAVIGSYNQEESCGSVGFNRRVAEVGGIPIYRHECCCREKTQSCPICRLFGSTGKAPEEAHAETCSKCKATNFPARLIVRDAFLSKDGREKLEPFEYSEVKHENTIDRITGAAMPRQMERIPRGAEFDLEFLYTVTDDADILTDLHNLLFALELLEKDSGLGGSVSRGYGQLELYDFSFTFYHNHQVRANGNERVLKMERVEQQDLEVSNFLFSQCEVLAEQVKAAKDSIQNQEGVADSEIVQALTNLETKLNALVDLEYFDSLMELSGGRNEVQSKWFDAFGSSYYASDSATDQLIEAWQAVGNPAQEIADKVEPIYQKLMDFPKDPERLYDFLYTTFDMGAYGRFFLTTYQITDTNGKSNKADEDVDSDKDTTSQGAEV